MRMETTNPRNEPKESLRETSSLVQQAIFLWSDYDLTILLRGALRLSYEPWQSAIVTPPTGYWLRRPKCST